ncbi:RNA methyltransferase [Flavobacteriaceae bacterium F89]|uniref:tRNA (guanosine(18)-2'-O)-methyltransferase n=1 Tax=Cerina litoralis TaxID=2874477 RepID=A0AAE3EUZ5_9FLAO|nr:RNA methyltransferase [Cerina litoralis]MCG2461005.1 RNA methyltransferase [Cerina litoralis]
MVDLQLLEYLEGFVTTDRKARFLTVLEERTKYLTIAIEDVYQMHNASAVIRTCEVFGVQNAHVIESRYGKRLDKDISLGAEKWVDVFRYNDTLECMEALREKGYKIVATTPHHNANLLADFKIDSKIALFFGTEKEGLSQTVLHNADCFLKIPMVGFTESLNISVSAAIILQSLTYKLKQTQLPWRLTPEEKLEKRLDWTKKSIRSLKNIMSRYKENK